MSDTFAAMMRASITAISAAQACQRDLRALASLVKDDASPVTVADFVVQTILVKMLSDAMETGAMPRASIVAEEDARTFATLALAARLDVVRRVNQALGDNLALDQVSSLLSRGQAGLPAAGLCFVIDPIDGTKGFIRGDQYATALGLIDDGVPTAGVLGCPNLVSHDGARIGCVFAAMRGQGAHEFTLDGTLSCALSARTQADDARPVRMLESFEASHFVGEAHAQIARACNVVETVRYDSQVKYGVLARGGACIMPRVTKYDNCVWDVAPGAAILAEAGGRVTDAAGQPLVYVAFGRRRRRAS